MAKKPLCGKPGSAWEREMARQRELRQRLARTQAEIAEIKIRKAVLDFSREQVTASFKKLREKLPVAMQHMTRGLAEIGRKQPRREAIEAAKNGLQEAVADWHFHLEALRELKKTAQGLDVPCTEKLRFSAALKIGIETTERQIAVWNGVLDRLEKRTMP